MTRVIQRVICGVFGVFLFGVVTSVAHAQTTPINSDLISSYGLRNLENAVVVHASPANPNPGDVVHFTVESPIYDLVHSTISWTINGKTVVGSGGNTSVDATVSVKGDPLDAIATVSDPVWGIASDEIVVVPAQLDILYDAPTYVPPFYRGRALPSAGGTMRLQAVAHFTQGGAVISDRAITYTWSRNGSVLGNISGLGRSAVTISAPALFGTDTITVRATTKDETLSATASIQLASTEPALVLYEDHPLFGITFHQALANQINQPGDISLAAIPYFAPVTGLNDANLQYKWTFDNASIQASSTKRNEISLNADTESSVLSLNVTHAVNFFMSVTGNWKFIFGGRSGSTNADTGASDAFHNGDI